MKKNKEEKHFLKMPHYKGGKEALQMFIRKNLNYPVEALKERIEGTVFLKYTIDYKGNVLKAKVLRGLGYGCDEEAIRIVKLLKFETFKTRKVKIRYHKEIKIHFKLPKNKTDRIEVSYNYTSSQHANNYTYTVKLNE